MKQLKLFSAIILFAGLCLACSGTAAKAPVKDIASGAGDAATADGGKDMFYEYITTSSGKYAGSNMSLKMYISAAGSMRVEMKYGFAGEGKSAVRSMTLIGHSDKPDESISIDDSAKTYSINHININDLTTGMKIHSVASKAGEEKISGFNCVHARIISTRSMGSFYSTADTIDLWKSNEIPMVASVKNLFEKFEARTGNTMYSPEVVNQLKQMGCDGLTAKLQMGSATHSFQQILTKAEHKAFSPAMFEIPAGYKEEKTGL